MTALDEVLKAEEEAKQTLKTAEEASAKAVEEAKTEQQTKLNKEKEDLAEVAKTNTANEQIRAKKMADEIVSDFDAQVKAVEERFEAKKDSLKEAVKKKFQ